MACILRSPVFQHQSLLVHTARSLALQCPLLLAAHAGGSYWLLGLPLMASLSVFVAFQRRSRLAHASIGSVFQYPPALVVHTGWDIASLWQLPHSCVVQLPAFQHQSRLVHAVTSQVLQCPPSLVAHTFLVLSRFQLLLSYISDWAAFQRRSRLAHAPLVVSCSQLLPSYVSESGSVPAPVLVGARCRSTSGVTVPTSLGGTRLLWGAPVLLQVSLHPFSRWVPVNQPTAHRDTLVQVGGA